MVGWLHFNCNVHFYGNTGARRSQNQNKIIFQKVRVKRTNIKYNNENFDDVYNLKKIKSQTTIVKRQKNFTVCKSYKLCKDV